LTTNLEILYKKNATGSTGTSSGIIRKSNSSGFLNYMQFNDANNSIYLLANKSGTQSYGNIFLSNGNLLLGSGSKIGIGTNSPTEKLSVNGTIRSREIKLEAVNWPDYVFGKGYGLMPLEEVKAYIDQKGHLPGFKPACEYGEEGVNMLELNQKLLEKVEELTLHAIVQEVKLKQLDDLRAELEILKQLFK